MGVGVGDSTCPPVRRGYSNGKNSDVIFGLKIPPTNLDSGSVGRVRQCVYI